MTITKKKKESDYFEYIIFSRLYIVTLVRVIVVREGEIWSKGMIINQLLSLRIKKTHLIVEETFSYSSQNLGPTFQGKSHAIIHYVPRWIAVWYACYVCLEAQKKKATSQRQIGDGRTATCYYPKGDSSFLKAHPYHVARCQIKKFNEYRTNGLSLWSSAVLSCLCPYPLCIPKVYNGWRRRRAGWLFKFYYQTRCLIKRALLAHSLDWRVMCIPEHWASLSH